MEKKENPNFDQEALELTCLDLFKVLHTHFSSLFSCKCKLKSRHLILTLHCLFAGRSGDNINNLALVTFSHSDSFVTFLAKWFQHLILNSGAFSTWPGTRMYRRLPERRWGFAAQNSHLRRCHHQGGASDRGGEARDGAQVALLPGKHFHQLQEKANKFQSIPPTKDLISNQSSSSFVFFVSWLLVIFRQWSRRCRDFPVLPLRQFRTGFSSPRQELLQWRCATICISSSRQPRFSFIHATCVHCHTCGANLRHVLLTPVHTGCRQVQRTAFQMFIR